VSFKDSPLRVLFPLGVAVCLSLFGDLMLYAVLPTQREVVGLSLGAVGIMLGINRLIRIPGNPVVGVILDRSGRRRLFILGMLLGTLSTLGYGLLQGFVPFLLTRLAWGVSWTLINVGGMAMVLDVSTPANRGQLTGFYNAWMLVGFALGPLGGGFLVDTIGFRAAMLIYAGVTAIGLLIAIWGLPETAPASNNDVVDQDPVVPLSRCLGGLWQDTKALLRTTPGLTSTLGLFLITQFAGEGIALSTINLLLKRRFGHTLSLGALALGIASASGILLALRSLLAGLIGPLAGRLSDAHIGRRPVIVGSLVMGMAGFGLLAIANSLWAIVLGVALGAASAGAGMATLAAYTGDLTPPGRRGAVMGVYGTAGDIGSAAGPFLAFALIPVVGLQWVYLICVLSFVAGLGLLWRTRTQRG